MTNYIGLMSGTSLDGVDGTLVSFGDTDADLTVVATHRHGSWLYRSVASVTGLTAALAQLAVRRPDVVHLHVAKRGSLVRKGVLAWAASALRVPVVLHCHGGAYVWGNEKVVALENEHPVQYGDLLFELEPLNGRPLDAL